MGTRWDSRKKLVVVEMSWQEARDLGQWLLGDGNDPGFGRDLVTAAKEGAGFHV